MAEIIVIVTGGSDPLHSGHIVYFEDAKKLGDKLIVGINSDEWLVNKKGRPFMPFNERLAIVKELSVVDQVLSFSDDDDTACGAIFKLMSTTASSHKIIFANGTPNPLAYAYNVDDGKKIWESALPYSGSAPPMAFRYKGCDIVVFTATGGIYVGYQRTGDSTVAYKLKSCKFNKD